MNANTVSRRILVVKLADLGDVLLCEPAFRSLRSACPNAQIDALVTPGAAELVRLLGHDLRTLVFPKALFDHLGRALHPAALTAGALLWRQLRAAHYDRVVLLHHLTTSAGAAKFRILSAATGSRTVVGLDNGRGTFLTHTVTDLGFGARHESDYMLAVAQAAGGDPVDSGPRVCIQNHAASRTLPPHVVAMYPVTGSYSSARTWPAARYGAVAAMLRAAGIQTVIVGGADAIDAAKEITRACPTAIDLSGQTTLGELAAVLVQASVVVGGDSFIGHFARALRRPVVAIFGPTNHNAWKPYGTSTFDLTQPGDVDMTSGVVVYHDLPCAPCIYSGFNLGRPNGCPTRTCLQRITADDIASIVRKIVEGN